MEIKKTKFKDSLFKFKMPLELKRKLNHADVIALTEIGLPKKILSNSFVYNEQVVEDGDGSIILGYNSHVEAWKLKINIANSSIFYSGKGNLTDQVYAYYNNSANALLLSLFSYDFFIQKLIASESFGEYHLNHEKYANLLFELISEIDNTAVEKGVWHSLIDEMRLGVI